MYKMRERERERERERIIISLDKIIFIELFHALYWWENY